MNPLKVRWFRCSAKARVCYSWILVYLGLHRKAPRRYRTAFVKAADWLEVTLQRLVTIEANHYLMYPDQQFAETTVHKMHADLKLQMISLLTSGNIQKEGVESVKGKILELLDLCGIKDADIPVFNETKLQHKRQTLITSFGNMFKSSSLKRPQRIRRNARCDPALYADRLIEQLLSQAQNTSPVQASDRSSIHDADNSLVPDFDNSSIHDADNSSIHDVDNSSMPNVNLSLLGVNTVSNPDPDTSSLWDANSSAIHNIDSSSIHTYDTSVQAADTTPKLPTSGSSGSLDVQFSSLFDIMESDLTSTSFNSVSTSDGYPKASETSPEIFLPSREEELRERAVFYCDITVGRQKNIDLSTASLENEITHTNPSPGDGELLVRTVEGAESSPKNIIKTTPSQIRPNKAMSLSRYRVSPFKTSGMRRQQKFYSSMSTSSSDGTSQRSLHHYSRRSESCRTCTTHPMASSTLIIDSETPSTDLDAASIYTWSIDEDSSSCNLEKSYLRSTSQKRKRQHKHSSYLSPVSSTTPLFNCNITSVPSLSCEPDTSLVHSSTDSIISSDSSRVNERPYITGQSSISSGSSPCAAARCRPRTVRTLKKEDNVLSHPNQELMDSVLTDSPQSVDSSGIFVPQNSYNSPGGSQNGYSSTASSRSSVAFVTRGCNAPPPSPPRKAPTRINSTGLADLPSQEQFKFKRPFTPSPHIDHTRKIRTKNQGVTAGSVSTPNRPFSVRSDPLPRHSLFVVPSGAITGPPKIRDKKSIVKKLKQFSSHFYRRTEKIKTLANL